MKECIIILAPREVHVRLYDPKILSTLKDRNRVLIANKEIEKSLSQEDKDSYDEIIFVDMIAHGPVELFFDKQELIALIAPYTNQFSPENVYIFTPDEFNIPVVAEVTTSLGANGFDSKKANLFRDKALMKDFLHQHSTVKLPDHVQLNVLPEYEILLERLGSPFVVKPLAGAASAGVQFIHSKDEWGKFINQYPDDLEQYEAETFLSEQLFHVDSIRHKGKTIASVICEYIHPIGNFIYGDPIASIIINHENPFYDSIVKLNKEVLEAFSVDGCFHLECFCDVGKEPVFLEIAWRQAGKPCNSNFEQVYDGCPQSLYYLLAVIERPLPKFDWSSYYRVDFLLPLREGVFNGVTFPDIDSKFTRLDLKIKKGENVLKQPKMYIDSAASFSLEHSNYSTLYRDFISLRDYSFYAE